MEWGSFLICPAHAWVLVLIDKKTGWVEGGGLSREKLFIFFNTLSWWRVEKT